MGGSMRARKPGPGQGSTFTFSIVAPVAESPRAIAGRCWPPATARRQRMLVVDDNATNRKVLTLQAAKWGMLPRDTGSPAEALRWIGEGATFDLAVLDMHMPEIDGSAWPPSCTGCGRPCRWCSSARSAGARWAIPMAVQRLPRQAAAASRTCSTRSWPCSATTTRPGRAGARTGRGARRGLAARHPLRILLAEDNVVNQKLALRLLQQMGYRADLASNGIEVIESIERQPTTWC
jgi:CheY-like chemotaxis protein